MLQDPISLSGETVKPLREALIAATVRAPVPAETEELCALAVEFHGALYPLEGKR